MDEPFGVRLAAAVARSGPLCAGIDPSASLLDQWGLPDDPSGLERFGRRCVDAFAGVLAVVKPQVAFFERHGGAGLLALEGVLAAARDAGLLVIGDAKRGDIDSTCGAYAEAWLTADAPFAVDAVTAHPFLGLGALAPLFDAAGASGRGVFVVVRSSNPEGRPLQQAHQADGHTVEDALLAGIADRNRADLPAGARFGSVGAVIGATLAPSSFDLSTLGGPILAPGLGAQGATPGDVAARFAGCATGSVLPSVSRSLLAAGPDAGALRRAAEAWRDELAAVSV